MSQSGLITASICPIGQFAHPRTIANASGLDLIAYRPGEYTSFRHAMLLPRPGETQLTTNVGGRVIQVWRPGAEGDLAVQMVEWWAYLCDVLAFYNERVANQGYLGTADLPESVNRLIALLGYRPRPGIGASGVLAALTTGSNPVTLPAGFQVQSKPGPGQPPQVFELGTTVTFMPPPSSPSSGLVQGAASLSPPPGPSEIGSGSILVKGVVGNTNRGDALLLLPRSWAGSDRNYALVRVADIFPEPDPDGKSNTRVLLSPGSPLGKAPSPDSPANYRLLRSGQVARPYQYASPPGLAQGQASIDLDSIVRQIQVGDPILIIDPRPKATNSPQAVSVTAYTEVIYYANNPTNPSQPPPQPTPSFSGESFQAAIPVPHSQLAFTPGLDSAWDTATVQVLYAWKDIGVPIDNPASTFGNQASVGPNGQFLPLPLKTGSPAPPNVVDVLIRDTIGNGATGALHDSNVQLSGPAPLTMPLIPPLQVLFNLLEVSCGKTVSDEVLGNGNALVSGQDFALQNLPVTYLQDPKSISGENYSSTVTVQVNHLRWTEVQSFFGQPADAQVFVTREDEQGRTHVVFGDGRNGSRLPTGTGNVLASYRYGSGAAMPSPGSLTVVLQPRPGLRSILNPVPIAGGEDADPPARVRKLGPRSVLTLGRAISIDDFEAVAFQAPGVSRAKAAFTPNPLTQTAGVTVWVGDDQGAVVAARAAFAASSDPNRLPRVVLADKVEITLGLTIVYDPKNSIPIVRDAVRSALIDPDAGLFGQNVVAIGQIFYDSQVYAACLNVPGVISVHSLQWNPPSGPFSSRHDPGAHAFFSLAGEQQPEIVMESGS